MPRTLLVDDSAVVRLTMGRRLRAAGHDVVACASFAEAVVVDLAGIARALLDFDLGDGRGVDVAPRLVTAGIPVAFFTSEDAPEVFDAARVFGPVFKKPDDVEAALAWATSAIDPSEPG